VAVQEGIGLAVVMPATAGIHVFMAMQRKQGVDGRDIGERSDAVLRTAKPGHDERLHYPNSAARFRLAIIEMRMR
jgi:hypothetical protein